MSSQSASVLFGGGQVPGKPDFSKFLDVTFKILVLAGTVTIFILNMSSDNRYLMKKVGEMGNEIAEMRRAINRIEQGQGRMVDRMNDVQQDLENSTGPLRRRHRPPIILPQ